mgnify:CR=1 FL=1
MDARNLKEGCVYNYTGGDESAKVMYTGIYGTRYGFRAYNEDTGKYDGHYNTLNVLSVLVLIKKN